MYVYLFLRIKNQIAFINWEIISLKENLVRKFEKSVLSPARHAIAGQDWLCLSHQFGVSYTSQDNWVGSFEVTGNVESFLIPMWEPV